MEVVKLGSCEVASWEVGKFRSCEVQKLEVGEFEKLGKVDAPVCHVVPELSEDLT